MTVTAITTTHTLPAADGRPTLVVSVSSAASPVTPGSPEAFARKLREGLGAG